MPPVALLFSQLGPQAKLVELVAEGPVSSLGGLPGESLWLPHLTSQPPLPPSTHTLSTSILAALSAQSPTIVRHTIIEKQQPYG